MYVFLFSARPIIGCCIADFSFASHRTHSWHDLPLFESDVQTGKPTGALNFVCEIPKWTRKKFELATKVLYIYVYIYIIVA